MALNFLLSSFKTGKDHFDAGKRQIAITVKIVAQSRAQFVSDIGLDLKIIFSVGDNLCVALNYKKSWVIH